MRQSKSKLHKEDPEFIHLEEVKRLKEELFNRFICHDEARQDVIVSSLLVRNARVLLTGNPEAGKTTLVRLIAKGLSRDLAAQSDSSSKIYAKVTGAPEQTIQKVISTTNISKLITEGEEEILVRPIVKAKIKFLNEINRFSKAVQDSFLSLLEEGEVEYGGRIFETPDFLCFADMNPHRGEIDLALKTRFMISIFLPFVGVRGDLSILDNMFFSGEETRDLAETMPEILSITELEEIWDDVTKVKFPNYVKAFLSLLLSAFKVCKHDKSKIMPGYLRTVCQKCEYSNEVCSQINKIPGERASIAAVLYTRARAWLQHRKEVTLDDVTWVLPWVIGHRIELTSAIKSEIPNPWQWARNAIENLLKTKWHHAESGEETYGRWAKGLALTAYALDWKIQSKLQVVLDKFYPNLSMQQNSQFEAVKELRTLAFGEEDETRGDLPLQELYKMVREEFKDFSQEIVKEVRPYVEEILAKENASLEEIVDAFNRLKKTLPEESKKLRDKLRAKLEKLTVRVSLQFPGRSAEAKKLLEGLGFPTSEINDLFQGKTLKLRNDNTRVQLSGDYLTFRAINPEVAHKIRKTFW